ncbi:MAK10-like protein [Tanacetum coccineum]
MCWNWSRTNLGVHNLAYLREMLIETSLADINDVEKSCVWTVGIDGKFIIGDSHHIIDSMIFPSLVPSTTWDKTLPKKVNNFIWRMTLDRLPHRLNLSSHDIDILIISCSSCNGNVESSNYIFFKCDIDMARRNIVSLLYLLRHSGGFRERGDDVAIIKQRHQDFHHDGIRDPATASGRGRLKEDLESSTWRRREANPIRTLGDYSKPSHEGYKNTIDLLKGNNAVPLRSVTIREYDLQVYIAITDHILWDIITNGDQATTDPASSSVPKTSLAANARRNNEKALNILLSAIPDRHLLSFHDATNAKTLWTAIKARFGGNEASKKMQKNLLKQQFETFTIGSREELDSAYERFQHILSMLELYDATVSLEDANLKFLRSLPSVWHVVATMIRGQPGLDELEFDDLYNNLKVYELELKGVSNSNSQNIAFCSIHHLASPEQTATVHHGLLPFLGFTKVPHHGIDLWLQVQIFNEHVNPVTRRTIDQSPGGKLHDRNAKESWALLEDLALYDNESWNDLRDFTKPVKEISLPQDVPSTSDHRLIELENQVQRLMEAHLAPKKPIQVNKITSSSEICSGPQDSHYCMKNPEQAFVEYASSRTDEAGCHHRIAGALPSDTVKNLKLNVNSTSPVLSARSYPTEDPQCSTQIHGSINTIKIYKINPLNDKPEEEEQEKKENPENINTNPSLPPDPSVSFIIEKVCKLDSFFESLGLVPQSSNT